MSYVAQRIAGMLVVMFFVVTIVFPSSILLPAIRPS